MENDYRITKLHGTLIGDNRIPDLPVGETSKILSSANGKTAWVDLPEGGKSVPPTLVLSIIGDDDIVQKTSITEEEKTNIENGLYNSVFYIDSSLGESGLYSSFFPETAFYFNGQFGFSTYSVSASDAGDIAITGSCINFLNIGTKSADGTYPITIQKTFQSTFGGGSFEDIDVRMLGSNSRRFGNFHITGVEITIQNYNIVKCTEVWFSGFISESDLLLGNLWVKNGKYLFLGSGTYQLDTRNRIYHGITPLGGKYNPVQVGAIKTLCYPQIFNSYNGTNLLDTMQGYTDGYGNFAFAGPVRKDANPENGNMLTLSVLNDVNLDATADETYCELAGLFVGRGIGSMAFKKASNGEPAFKSFATWLPPITAADEGKSLVVKNGNGQWATIDTSNYGKLDALSSNDWNSSNVFRGVTTLYSPTIVGGISSDGGGDQILIDKDLSRDFGSLFKRVTGFVSTYQTPTSVAFEALGFINENGFGDLSKASVLSFVSTTGKSQWIEPSTNTKYNYQLPKKSGTIALTSDIKATHQHTIVIKEGSKIIFAANKDLASATPVTTLETLISTFKDTTTAGFGDYILLTVDTAAKLTKQDGTETDLSTLTVAISDTVK